MSLNSVRMIIRKMIVTLQAERLRTVEQIRAFLEGNAKVDFRPADRDAAYGSVRRTLVRLRYGALDRPGKGAVREYLGKTTGLSRAQVTRLIGRYRTTGAGRGSARRQQRAPLRAGSTRRPTSGC